MSRRSFYSIIVVLCVLCGEIALVCSGLAFPVLMRDDPELYTHVFAVLAPLAMAAVVLDPRLTMGLSVATSLLVIVHAHLLPMDYFEAYFSSPMALVIIPLVTLWMVLTFPKASGNRYKLWPDDREPLRPLPSRVALLALVSLMTAFLCLVISQTVVNITQFDMGLLPALQEFSEYITDPAAGVQVVGAALCVFVPALVSTISEDYRRKSVKVPTTRTFFSQGLGLGLIMVATVAMSLSYTIETLRALSAAQQELEEQAKYFSSQIVDFADRRSKLERMENELVLGHAGIVASIIEANPALATDQEALAEIGQTLGLASMNIADSTGVLVGTMDGVGVGEFNFYGKEGYEQYVELLEGRRDYVVEEPRSTKNASTGEYTGNVEVFAAVPRKDEAGGLVMVSISANEYANDVEAVSIENLATGYHFGGRGLVYLIKDDKIVTSNDQESLGKPIPDYIEFMLSANTVYDDGMMDTYNGATREEMYGLVTTCKISAGNAYQIVLLLPSKTVFDERNQIAVWNVIVYLLVFLVIYILITLLINNVIVKRLTQTNDVLGLITAGDLDQTVEVNVPLEFETLSRGINATVGALKESIAAEAARIDRELATAKAIQQSALPRTFPPFPEVSDFDIFAQMKPAREVGGDFYDFFLVDDHTLGFIIADVSGKGIPASLFMMAAKTELDNYLQAGLPVAEAVASANARLCVGNEAGMFVTAWVATLDYKTGLVTYVNAGHNPPLLRHDGSWEWLRGRSGVFLGAYETARYRSQELTMSEGDFLLLYTDGVSEAMDVNSKLYGEERLERLLEGQSEAYPQTVIKAVFKDLAQWSEGAEQSDDITMLALEYGVAPKDSGSISVLAQPDTLGELLGFVHGELARRTCPIGTQEKIDEALKFLFERACRGEGTCTLSYLYNANPNVITIQMEDDGPAAEASDYQEIDHLIDGLTYLRDENMNVVAFNIGW